MKVMKDLTVSRPATANHPSQVSIHVPSRASRDSYTLKQAENLLFHNRHSIAVLYFSSVWQSFYARVQIALLLFKVLLPWRGYRNRAYGPELHSRSFLSWTNS